MALSIPNLTAAQRRVILPMVDGMLFRYEDKVNGGYRPFILWMDNWRLMWLREGMALGYRHMDLGTEGATPVDNEGLYAVSHKTKGSEPEFFYCCGKDNLRDGIVQFISTHCRNEKGEYYGPREFRRTMRLASTFRISGMDGDIESIAEGEVRKG